MGFDDSDFDKVEGNLSNTQLYKQAGNSIVVNDLEEIYKELFKSNSPDKISASERLPEKKYESTLFAEAVAHCEKIVINGKVVKGKWMKMTAREMFKKLGYKYNKYRDRNQMIEYRKEDSTSVLFWIEERVFSVSEYCEPKDITVDELKAINQQCKELGWI